MRLIAHRGVHQTFHRENLENDTCTAERIYPPEHDYLENTLRSMEAAFAAGADIVELDVHPTTDGHFAVIHDWTVDCRTEGTGETRSHDLAYLKTLDIGYGYTADGGATYPVPRQGRRPDAELRRGDGGLPRQAIPRQLQEQRGARGRHAGRDGRRAPRVARRDLGRLWRRSADLPRRAS